MLLRAGCQRRHRPRCRRFFGTARPRAVSWSLGPTRQLRHRRIGHCCNVPYLASKSVMPAALSDHAPVAKAMDRSNSCTLICHWWATHIAVNWREVHSSIRQVHAVPAEQCSCGSSCSTVRNRASIKDTVTCTYVAPVHCLANNKLLRRTAPSDCNFSRHACFMCEPRSLGRNLRPKFQRASTNQPRPWTGNGTTTAKGKLRKHCL